MRGWLIGVLALVVVAASGCGDNKGPAGPSGTGPVISLFAVTPASGKAPIVAEFSIKTDRAQRCEIPGIGDVTCNGVKTWPLNVAGTYTFTLYAFGIGGEIARQSAVVVVTP